MVSDQPLINDPLKAKIISDIKKSRVKTQSQNPILKVVVGIFVYFTAPLLLIATFLSVWVVPFLIRFVVLQHISFFPGSDFYRQWKDLANPTFLYVHMFNVTNPEEVTKGGFPVFKEMGPYTFREKRAKIVIVANDYDDTVRYTEHISYHFEQELSGHFTLDDKVTMINVPYVAAATVIADGIPWPMNDIARNVLSRYKEPLFITKTIGQAMFHGWHVEFLEKLQEELDVQFLANNTFSLMMGLNDTAQGPFLVSRGSIDTRKFGTLYEYRNKTELDWWPKGTSCRKLNGTDATIHAPFIERGDNLYSFIPEVCRSFYLKYEKDVQFEGITAYRYLVPPALLKSSVKYEENRCYCVHIDEDPGKCLKDGTIDLGPCRDGAPIAMSTVYFLDADSEYSLKSGLQPNRSIHEGFFIVEPLTGLVFELSKKIQINFVLSQVKGFKAMSKVPEMLFPIFWVDEVVFQHTHLEQSSVNYMWRLLFLLKIGKIGVDYMLPLLILIASAISLLVKVNNVVQTSKDAKCSMKENSTSTAETNAL